MRCPSQHFLAGQVLYPASIIAGDGEGVLQLLLRELSDNCVPWVFSLLCKLDKMSDSQEFHYVLDFDWF